MMTINELKQKWDILTSEKSLRISASCIPEIYIGIRKDGERCVMLFLKEKQPIDFSAYIRRNLTIEHISEKNVIAIYLRDSNFADLFNDLILSVYHRVKDIENEAQAAKEFVTSFNKWVHFFEKLTENRLDVGQIKGLWGEIHELNYYLASATTNNVNYVLKGWRGPYDTSSDFVFDTEHIEIKTIDEGREIVKIASEHQLDKPEGKELRLLVISLNTDTGEGLSLYSLLTVTLSLIREKHGDVSILYQALKQKSLTMNTVREYDNHRFVITQKRKYNAGAETFPKITRSNLPRAIERVSYQLKLFPLKTFLIEEIRFKNGS